MIFNTTALVLSLKAIRNRIRMQEKEEGEMNPQGGFCFPPPPNPPNWLQLTHPEVIETFGQGSMLGRNLLIEVLVETWLQRDEPGQRGEVIHSFCKRKKGSVIRQGASGSKHPHPRLSKRGASRGCVQRKAASCDCSFPHFPHHQCNVHSLNPLCSSKKKRCRLSPTEFAGWFYSFYCSLAFMAINFWQSFYKHVSLKIVNHLDRSSWTQKLQSSLFKYFCLRLHVCKCISNIWLLFKIFYTYIHTYHLSLGSNMLPSRWLRIMIERNYNWKLQPLV